jgi:hypothetical protein
LILSDYTIPGVDTREALALARQIRPETPFIFLSGTMGEDLAIETSRRPLLAHMDHWDAAYAALRECTRPSRLLELTFEEDIERDPMLGYRKVCEFLDLAPAPVDLRLGRSNPFPLRSMIANYDEVLAHLRGTDREWMLDD